MDRARAQVEGLRPGHVVAGSLQVEALLGQGGTAAVYRVRDQGSGRRLALKWLQPPDDERRALVTSQFQREYHTLAQLAHPRIIEVHDYGLEQGDPYYTMELLNGEDLHERGQLAFRQACALLCDVASSLAMLHSRRLVHRDVSARNVRCTADGRAKLIDFGAMVPMGATYRAIGTPPFVPPEALQLQALDGRADLYGLGALAYWCLTGRHAYPAQTFNQLRDAWRTVPRNPRYYAADVPEPLAELVMSLLRLERGERPRSAGEVMERLCGIAGLPLQELAQVGRAYLIAPVLVAREDALAQARAALLEALRAAHGSALWITGPPGVGRSRMLEACVLEAKLMGAVVLRAGPAEAGQAPYGLVRALASQLIAQLPALCDQSARPRLALLAHVVPEFAMQAAPSSGVPERRHLQAALRDWLLAIARSKHVVIAVDDVAAIDEPSAALLGALAHGAKRRHLSLLLTARSGAPDSAAMQLLHELSRHLVLRPLDATQNEALLRSLFGDADRLLMLADRIHAAAQGLPRSILALAEHLVARGAARYEAGSWTLPRELSDADLPHSEREAHELELAGLGADARALAQALSLTDPSALSLPDYPALTEHGEPGRTFRALDELVAARLLLPEGDGFRPIQPAVFASLERELSEEARHTLHARLAAALRSSPRTSLRQLHMLRGGLEREALQELLAMPPDTLLPGLLPALECAATAAQRALLPLRQQLTLQLRLVRLSAVMGDQGLFMRFAWPLLDRLERDSSMRDYMELDPGLDSAARVAEAFARAQQRYDATAETERGFPPRESLMMVVALYGSCGTMGGLSGDPSIAARRCSLKPWVALSPVIELMEQAADITRYTAAEQHYQAHQVGTRLVAALDTPSARATMPFMRAVLLYGNACHHALHGNPACLERAAELDPLPGYRGNAWRVRMLHDMAHGDLEHARECRQRAELLDLQDTQGRTQPESTVGFELEICLRLEDLDAAKRCVEHFEALAALYPYRRPALRIARSYYEWLRGDLSAAFAELEPLLSLTGPESGGVWLAALEMHLRLLHARGQYREACDLASSRLTECEQRNSDVPTAVVQRLLADELLALGQVERAQQLADESLAAMRRYEYFGVWLGWGHETCARVAIAQRDATALREHAELCARHYAVERNPGLNARYERLLRKAELVGMPLSVAAPVRADNVAGPEDVARTVYSRMLTCISPTERAERGLQLVLEATGAESGYLFGLRSGKLQGLASTEAAEPPGLRVMLDDFVQREFEVDVASAGRTPARRPSTFATFIDELSREFEALLLSGRRQGESVIAGVAALHFRDDDRPAPRSAMLDAVVEALIADDVVDAITCVGS